MATDDSDKSSELNDFYLVELAVHGFIREHDFIDLSVLTPLIRSLCIEMIGSLDVFHFNYSELASVFTDSSMSITQYQLFHILNRYAKELLFLELNQVQTDKKEVDILYYFIARALKRKLSFTTTEIREFYDILYHHCVWFMTTQDMKNYNPQSTSSKEFNIENMCNIFHETDTNIVHQICNLVLDDVDSRVSITDTMLYVFYHMIGILNSNKFPAVTAPPKKLPFCLTNSFLQKIMCANKYYIGYKNKEYLDAIEAIVKLMNGIKLDTDYMSWDLQQTMLDLIKHKLPNVDYTLPYLDNDIEILLKQSLVNVPDIVEVFAIEFIEEYTWLKEVFVREEKQKEEDDDDDETFTSLNIGNLCNLYSECNHITVVLPDLYIVAEVACLSLFEDMKDIIVNKKVELELKWPSYHKLYDNQLKLNAFKQRYEDIGCNIRSYKTSITISPRRETEMTQIVLNHSIIADLNEDEAPLASYHDLFVCGYIHENIMIPHNLWIPDAIKSLCVRFVGKEQIDAIYIRRHVNICDMDNAQFITVLRVTIDNLGYDIDADEAAGIAFQYNLNGNTIRLGSVKEFKKHFKEMGAFQIEFGAIYKEIDDIYGEGKAWKRMDLIDDDIQWISDDKLKQYALDAPVSSKRTKCKGAENESVSK